jgi:SAM-dependent methyltransferase
MKTRLLPYLICPVCPGSDLRLSEVHGEESGEVMEGTLVCSAGHTFPITRGVPRLLPGRTYDLGRETQRNFSFSWRKFAEIYSDPRDFLDWIQPRTPADFQGRLVLDAGCGSGQHALFASDFGAREVVAFDLSPSVELAFAHARSRDNIHIVQADIYHLPFKPVFGLIYSIGVLQHIPDTPRGFAALAALLAKGGAFSIWVYGYEGTTFVRRAVDPARRVLSRLPLFPVFVLSGALAAVFFLLAKMVYGPLARGKTTRRIAQALPMGEYMSYMSQFNLHYVFNSVFDQLIAPITQYFRRDEVAGWFEAAGLRNVRLNQRNGMSWRATGERG